MPSLRPVESRIAALLFRILLPLLALSLPAISHAQTTPAVSTILAFSGSATSSSPVVGPGGDLYGITSTNTFVTGGLIYRSTVDGSLVQTVYQLRPEDGYGPVGGLLIDGDGLFFYGTTRLSGNQTPGTGTVFKVGTDGAGYTVLHNFAVSTGSNQSLQIINTDGAFPESALVEGSDGYLYGVTTVGGANGTGTVFKLARDGSDFQTLHEFGPITSEEDASPVLNDDGIVPSGPLLEGADGYFYGMAQQGGVNGAGTLFRLSFDGTEFQTLRAFPATTASDTGPATNVEGAVPVGGLTDGGDGFLYGVARAGGASGYGSVYSLAPDGSVFTVLHAFDGPNGVIPVGALLLGNDGKLYGTTSGGGTNASGDTTSFGTIFSIARDGTEFTKLYSFDSTHGVSPVGRLLQLSDSVLVGVTASGGSCGQGTLYRFSFDGDTVTGNTRCGRRKNNDSGGGSTAPALLLILGVLGFARRMRMA